MNQKDQSEAIDKNSDTVEQRFLLEAAEVERVVQIACLECIRPALAIDRNKMRNLQFDGLQKLDASWAAHHNRISQQFTYSLIKTIGLNTNVSPK